MAIKVQFNPSTGKVSFNPVTGKVQVFNDAGELCNNCWGEEGVFGQETPSSIIVTVSGIQKTALWTSANGEPPDGDYELTQLNCESSNVSACGFTYSGDFHCPGGGTDKTRLFYGFASTSTTGQCVSDKGFVAFTTSGTTVSECVTTLDVNGLDTNPFAVFNGGSMTVNI